MANKVQELSELLADLEYDFGVRDSAIHMLAVLQDFWEADIPVRTTDLLNNFTHTSRATTHRMLQELVSRRVLKLQVCPDDRRIKFVTAGPRFSKYEQRIKDAL